MAKKAAVKTTSKKVQTSGPTLKRSISVPLPKAMPVVKNSAPYEKSHAPAPRHVNSAPAGK